MNWIAVLPLIIDLIKEAVKLVSAIPDPVEKSSAKEGLRAVLQDYEVHQDVGILQESIRTFNGGVRR